MTPHDAAPARPRRSALSVPGDRPDRVRKALASAADEVVVDLEDAVAPDGKEAARGTVVDLLAALDPAERDRLAVRVNGRRTPWYVHDVAALAACATPPAGVVLPMAESAEDLRDLDRRLAGTQVRTQALVETAEGLHRVDEIAGTGDRLLGLVLGYADLATSLGRDVGPGGDVAWLPVQHALLLAARRHGVQALDGPFLDFRDTEGGAAAHAWAARLGFDGTWVVHPAQLDAANAAFTPTAEQVSRARAVVDAFEESLSGGAGAVGLDGAMLDRPVYDRARQVLARAAD
ncbi:citrate lyase subunit beta [Marmoricola endophyticus]|uniref:Citrate lyase subunit beta n=1 Tax=Marmoricola endophyticus TaxID=2040280 RepID=A0A917BL73_9ACTN|nr:CoA ester lyase [Marmoricola endophyticus]GGF48173.1 citrate lyase subunit beta [Marmoricola endophyticus]